MTTQRKTSDVLNWLHVSIPKWLSSATPSLSESGLQIECLAGDGSQRTFYRLHVTPAQKSAAPESYIVLSDPEWQLSKDYSPHQAYLSGRAIPVPRFFHEDVAAGYLVMEDLGDELLQHRIQADSAKREGWLRQATELLADLHKNTFPPLKSLPASQRRFDAQKYKDEMLFTAEHLVSKFLGLPFSLARYEAEITQFCAAIAAIGPDVFCHRDYHCRNLLVHQDKLWMIDFQDARLGSPHYDLASLVYDAYVPISDSFREELVALYRARISGTELDKAIAWNRFASDLKKIAFQRVIKAAGSFASFFTRFEKSTHLPYLAPALNSAVALQKEMKELPQGAESFFRPADWLTLVEKHHEHTR